MMKHNAPKIEIYTTNTCGYCVMAKNLLLRKGLNFVEIDVRHDNAERVRMTARAGGRSSVPQIFIGKTHVGGCDDLYALEAQGGLDRLLVSE